MVAARDPQLVGLEQHLTVREAVRRLEAIRRQLDREPERVVEVDRVHEASILDAAVLIPRASRRSTAWSNVAFDSEIAMWWTQPGSVDVRRGSGVRYSLVNTVISRPSPGSK